MFFLELTNYLPMNWIIVYVFWPSAIIPYIITGRKKYEKRGFVTEPPNIIAWACPISPSD